MTKDLHTLNNHEKAADSRTVFGFWTYLMTDLVLFAALFAVYAVFRGNTFGGPSSQDIFSLPFVLTETLILLTSSFTCGLAFIAARGGHIKEVLFALGATFALGAMFLVLELSEFSRLVAGGNSWMKSGFLSSYFTLVGTHGLHIAAGLIWLAVLMGYIFQRGINRLAARKLVLFTLFWHFLDVVWIFIFTIVYLLGIAA
jgi:cytochrome o ubiquinol oxidase subunit 3